MAYEARQAELMDQRSRMISAEMRGREEGRKGVARFLLARGMSVDGDADIAGMTREKVDELRRKNKLVLPVHPILIDKAHVPGLREKAEEIRPDESVPGIEKTKRQIIPLRIPLVRRLSDQDRREDS